MDDVRANDHPGMMGDGTEEQNLGQRGDPSARIGEAEVDEAFAHTPSTPGPQRAAAIAAGLQERARAGKDWVSEKTDAVAQWTSERTMDLEDVIVEKPAVVFSATAIVVLAVGLAVGFVLGRSTVEQRPTPYQRLVQAQQDIRNALRRLG